MKKQDGGPAFPTEGVVCSDGILYEGMTLRDYFAAKAMHGLIERGFTEFGTSASMYANLAYEYADAMLKAREE